MCLVIVIRFKFVFIHFDKMNYVEFFIVAQSEVRLKDNLDKWVNYLKEIKVCHESILKSKIILKLQ